ncbi:hypothetical protein FR943_10030 [Mycobacterium sp. TNTM28]|uniref:Proline rich protein n=1 Tax=[Mycobacterium] fortunisiensis TaxID=2600579 RepID=A0ABS6KL01_9MYCO|nr:hypothetical protein [[Mycobacterium] fortunisiensis]MBU9764179.1 hypothetical protein [[Mycobacterium] fortunisiensis]
MKIDFSRVTDAATRIWRGRLGRLRTSTVVLIVVFIALSWVQQQYRPEQAPPQTPNTQVVPPGFVPDPDYTWVPRTKVAPRTTTETTEPTETTTTEPTETTETTTPGAPGPETTTAPGSPRTTVFEPDGPGLLPPVTLPVLPGAGPAPTDEQQQPAQEPVTPTLPR